MSKKELTGTLYAEMIKSGFENLKKNARFHHSKKQVPQNQPTTPPTDRTECGTGEAYPPPPYAENLITSF